MVQTITVVVKAIDKATGTLKETEKRVTTLGRGFEQTTKHVKNAQGQWEEFSQTTTRGMARFRMHLLSVMFFGMMMQRFFLGLARSGVEAMMKITEGQTVAAQSITRLSAGWMFLKFQIGEAIGSALTPFMDTIMGIIDAITDWIDRNPELVGWLIILGGAIASVLFVGASLGLAADGLATTFGGLGKVIGALKWSKLVSGITRVRNAMSPLLIKVMLIIAVVIALWQAWEHNWFNIRQFTGKVVQGIANAFFILTEAGQYLLVGMQVVWNGILTAVEMAASPIIDLINGIAGAYAFFTGTEFKPIKKDFLNQFKVAKDDLDEFITSFDKWQRKVGQGLYTTGENIFLSGERMNRGSKWKDQYSITGMVGGAVQEVSKAFTVNEMNINVNGGGVVEGGRELGRETMRGMEEEMSNYGYTTRGTM